MQYDQGILLPDHIAFSKEGLIDLIGLVIVVIFANVFTEVNMDVGLISIFCFTVVIFMSVKIPDDHD